MEPFCPPQASFRSRIAALTLIVLAILARLLYLSCDCPLDLAPDEAHYWEWSRHLDWCYYSKGPLVAWLIRLSCELFGTLSQSLIGSEMLAVRLPAVVCGGLLLVALYVLTLEVYQSEPLALAVIALALTSPIITAGSALMTIDSPLICAWMWALVFGHRALFRSSRWAWPLAGVCVLLGVLAKHTMILWVPSLALLLLTTPDLRSHLWRPGFWLLSGIGALGGVPLLIWNAENGWVTLKHSQNHTHFDDALFHPLGPLLYFGSQLAVLCGFWFVAWARAMWHHRATREAQPELRFLWWMSLPTFVFFGLFSMKNGGGEANWPLPCYLSGMVLAAGWMSREWRDSRPWYRHLVKTSTVGFAALGLLLCVVMHVPLRLQPVLMQLSSPASGQRPMSIRCIDPTARLRGWRCLAADVDHLRAELKAAGVEPILASGRWTVSAELAFYCQEHPTVYCLGLLLGDRHSQYDLWHPNPLEDGAIFHGRTFLLVNAETDLVRRAFTACEPMRVCAYRENGEFIEQWTIIVAHGFRGFGRLPGAGQY
jgi:hypothetical protein